MSKSRARLTDQNDPLNQTDQVLEGFERLSQSATQEASKSASQQVDKLILRKATFQLSEALLERLDTYHLQLQLEVGKTNAPYKAVIVEEAISQWLDQVGDRKTEVLVQLQERQQRRIMP